jgi:hypothetical protein
MIFSTILMLVGGGLCDSRAQENPGVRSVLHIQQCVTTSTTDFPVFLSDSTFDGTQNFVPFPTGKDWGAVNDFYLPPGGRGKFGENLNSQGFPNPLPLATLNSWLPDDALHLASVPLARRIPPGGTGKTTLQSQVENIFSVPMIVNSGDCMLVIYGSKGNGATDNETQVKVVVTP